MTWRYQAVWREGTGVLAGERHYSICEVYLDDDGRLANWTENPAIAPGGESWEDLQRSVGRMYEECWNFEPVAVADLQAGMTFRRRQTKPCTPLTGRYSESGRDDATNAVPTLTTDRAVTSPDG